MGVAKVKGQFNNLPVALSGCSTVLSLFLSSDESIHVSELVYRGPLAHRVLAYPTDMLPIGPKHRSGQYMNANT